MAFRFIIWDRTHVIKEMEIPENIMVADLDAKTLVEVSQALDVERFFGDDCRVLARKVGLSDAEIDQLWKEKAEGSNRSPTESVLNRWKVRTDATVKRLVQFLQQIGRLDAVGIIEKGIKILILKVHQVLPFIRITYVHIYRYLYLEGDSTIY